MIGLKGTFANEAVILCVLPFAVLPVLLAIRYQICESEASSTLILTSVAYCPILRVVDWCLKDARLLDCLT